MDKYNSKPSEYWTKQAEEHWSANPEGHKEFKRHVV